MKTPAIARKTSTVTSLGLAALLLVATGGTARQ